MSTTSGAVECRAGEVRHPPGAGVQSLPGRPTAGVASGKAMLGLVLDHVGPFRGGRQGTVGSSQGTGPGRSFLAGNHFPMELAFSEWWRKSIRERSISGQHKARAERRLLGRPTVLTERQKEYVKEELAKGVSQRELARTLEVSRWKIQQLCQ